MTTGRLEKVLMEYSAHSQMNWKEVVAAVNEYKEQHPDEKFDHISPDGRIDRMLDGIATSPCWVKDRLNGDQKITTKVRKALGYYG